MTEIDRRGFSAALAAGLCRRLARRGERGAELAARRRCRPAGGLTDVAGLSVGHFTDSRRPTGCTVVLAEAGAVCGVDVRGGAPGHARDRPARPGEHGPAGARASCCRAARPSASTPRRGVVRYLEEKGIGFPVGVGKVPIVPAAILFDLGVGDWKIRPDANAGYAAARAASTGPVAEGCVGAGAGATVGKLLGLGRAMKAGIGSASLRLPNGAVVAALVAVNALGDVVDPADRPPARGLAHARTARRCAGRSPRCSPARAPGRPLAGREHGDRRRGHERRADQERGDQGRADGPRRPRAGDPPGAHALGRRHAVRALDGRRPARAARRCSSGRSPPRSVARAVVRAVLDGHGLPGLPSAADLARG